MFYDFNVCLYFVYNCITCVLPPWRNKRWLVRHSNLGPILHHFGDITGVLGLMTPPLFHPNFEGVSVGPDRPCWGQPEQISRSLKLFGRELIFEVFRTMWSRYLNVTDRRSDGGITALCVASRGNNNKFANEMEIFAYLWPGFSFVSFLSPPWRASRTGKTCTVKVCH